MSRNDTTKMKEEILNELKVRVDAVSKEIPYENSAFGYGVKMVEVSKIDSIIEAMLN